MEQLPPRKGMSKGCLIALIVAGVLLLLMIIIFGLICANRDKIVQAGTKYVVLQMKVQVVQQKVAGLDTVQFDMLVDSFVARVDKAPLTEAQTMQISTDLRAFSASKPVDSAAVKAVIDLMIKCYPDLEPYRPGPKTEAAPAGAVPPADSMAKPK